MTTQFEELVGQGVCKGEVVDAQSFSVSAIGMTGIPLGAMMLFNTSDIGVVRSIDREFIQIDILTSGDIPIGAQVVMMNAELEIRVSDRLLGRIVDPLMRPLDSKGPILSLDKVPVISPAPTFSQREKLSTQLETGVTIVDTLFPVVKGQRIAIMGDSKSGKSNFAVQTAINQSLAGSIVVLVMIAKRQSDIEQLVERLDRLGALDNIIIVSSDSFVSLPLGFMAPYSGCAVGEYFWHMNKDVVVIYDDLTAHAKLYREMSLLKGINPGRESFPGDMFYTHSSLLERAGVLNENSKALTALPIVTTSNNDITSFLSTSLISITDGQIVFDIEEQQKGSKPPINTGMSVSRVGGRAQERLHKELAQDIFKALAQYRIASEFAHFGQDLPEQYKSDIRIGERLRSIFNQEPEEFHTLAEQQILLSCAFIDSELDFNIEEIKLIMNDLIASTYEGNDYRDFAEKLVKESMV
ncbi:MAG: sodium-transporting two-sector ATPase [Acidimicrobiia bacterium]